MQVRILKTIKGATSPAGTHTTEYKAGETYDIYESLATILISNGFASEVKNIEIEKKKFEKKFENKAIEKSPENKSSSKKRK